MHPDAGAPHDGSCTHCRVVVSHAHVILVYLFCMINDKRERWSQRYYCGPVYSLTLYWLGCPLLPVSLLSPGERTCWFRPQQIQHSIGFLRLLFRSVLSLQQPLSIVLNQPNSVKMSTWGYVSQLMSWKQRSAPLLLNNPINRIIISRLHGPANSFKPV